MREYTKEKDHNGEFRNQPKHDWSSHPCDALRTLAVGLRRHQMKVPDRLYPKLAIV